jgi:hypothetical protein
VFDQKIIFVCYFIGSGGHLISALADTLLGNTTDSYISPFGEVIRKGFDQKVSNFVFNSYPGNVPELEIGKVPMMYSPTLTREALEIFHRYIKSCSFFTNQDCYVIPLHFTCVDLLFSNFPNSKIILIFPNSTKEMEFCAAKWNKKKIGSGIIQTPDPKLVMSDRAQINKLDYITKYKDKFIELGVADIFNTNLVEENINGLISFLNVSDTHKQSAIDFYNLYLKINC